jgi:hypothetical protein
MLEKGNYRFAFSRFATAFAVLLATSFLQAGAIRAQQATGLVPQFEVAGEYSYIRSNPGNSNDPFNLHGGIASFSYNFNDRFSVVSEFNAARFTGLPNGVSSTMYTYLFGSRVSLRKSGRWSPFVQALFGGGRLNASSGGVNAGENSFAMALGGGIDLHLHSHLSFRLLQANYLLTRFNGAAGNSETQNDLRISSGIVLRFGSR